MKKAVLVIFLLVMAFSLVLTGTSGVVYASNNEVADTTFSTENKGTEFRVPKGSSYTVYTNTDDGEKALFKIPETYYFKYVKSNPNGDKHYIEYNGITSGIYIKNNSAMALTDVDKEPRGGFTLSVTFENSVDYYYYDDFFTKDTLTNADTLTITLIGFADEFTYQSTTLQNPAYVKVGETYGFIDNALLKVKDTNASVSSYIDNIPLHTNYQPTTSDNTNSDKKSTSTNKLTRTILIIGIVIPALIIVLLLFMPRKQSRYDYDRNHAGDYGTSPYDQPRSRYRDDYNDGYQGRGDQDDGYYDNRRR